MSQTFSSSKPNRMVGAIVEWTIADLAKSWDRWPRAHMPPSWTVPLLMERFGIEQYSLDSDYAYGRNNVEQMLRNRMNTAYKRGRLGKLQDADGKLVRYERAVSYTAPDRSGYGPWSQHVRMWRP